MSSSEELAERDRSRIPQVRERYERTPRELDERLTALARGDRGCLGDAVTIAGALLTPILGLWASRGGLPLLVPLAGVGIVVAGIALQRRAQRRSTRERTLSLRSGSLVCAWLVEPLVSDGEGAVAAPVERRLAVCTTAPARSFDSAYLARVAERVAEAGRTGTDELGDLFRNRFARGFRRVPARMEAEDETYAVRVVVHADRRSDGAGTAEPAPRLPGPGIPGIPCIVDVEREFIEQV